MITKISGIIPTSARIESADLRSERPVRSGAPSIGQPVAMTAEQGLRSQNVTPGGLVATDFENALNSARPKSDNSIVEDISNSFFMKERSSVALGSELEPGPRPEGKPLSIRV